LGTQIHTDTLFWYRFLCWWPFLGISHRWNSIFSTCFYHSTDVFSPVSYFTSCLFRVSHLYLPAWHFPLRVPFVVDCSTVLPVLFTVTVQWEVGHRCSHTALFISGTYLPLPLTGSPPCSTIHRSVRYCFHFLRPVCSVDTCHCLPTSLYTVRFHFTLFYHFDCCIHFCHLCSSADTYHRRWFYHFYLLIPPPFLPTTCCFSATTTCSTFSTVYLRFVFHFIHHRPLTVRSPDVDHHFILRSSFIAFVGILPFHSCILFCVTIVLHHHFCCSHLPLNTYCSISSPTIHHHFLFILHSNYCSTLPAIRPFYRLLFDSHLHSTSPGMSFHFSISYLLCSDICSMPFSSDLHFCSCWWPIYIPLLFYRLLFCSVQILFIWFHFVPFSQFVIPPFYTTTYLEYLFVHTYHSTCLPTTISFHFLRSTVLDSFLFYHCPLLRRLDFLLPPWFLCSHRILLHSTFYHSTISFRYRATFWNCYFRPVIRWIFIHSSFILLRLQSFLTVIPLSDRGDSISFIPCSNSIEFHFCLLVY